MGLYDNYRLSNSTRIPEFAGSYLQEAAAAKADLDVKYTRAKDVYDTVHNGIGATPVLSINQKDFDKVHGEVLKDLEQVSGRPDFENMVPLTKEIADRAAKRVQPFVENVKAAGEYRKLLADKETNLSNDRQQDLYNYTLEKNARGGNSILTDEYGNTKGNFQAGIPAKSVDHIEFVKKAMEGAIAQSGEEIRMAPNGTGYLIKTESGWTKMPPARIRSIINQAYTLDPNIQADDAQSAAIAGWKFGKNAENTYKTLGIPNEDGTLDPFKGQVKTAIDKLVANKMPLADAVEQVMGDATLAQSRETLANLAISKYEQNDIKSSRTLSTDDPYFKHIDAVAKAKESEETRLVIPGPTTTIATTKEVVETQIKSFGQEITKTEAEISTLEATLAKEEAAGTLSSDAKAQAEVNINKKREQIESLRATKRIYDGIKLTNLNQATADVTAGANLTYASVVAESVPKIIEKLKIVKSMSNLSKEKLEAVAHDIANKNYTVDRQNNITLNGSKITINSEVETPSTMLRSSSGKREYYNPLVVAISHIVGDKKLLINKVHTAAEKTWKADKSLVSSTVNMSKEARKAVQDALLPGTMQMYKVGTLEPFTLPVGTTKVESSQLGTDGRVIGVAIGSNGETLGTFQSPFSGTGLADQEGLKIMSENRNNPILYEVGRNLLTNSGSNLLVRSVMPGATLDQYNDKPMTIPTGSGEETQVYFKRSNDGIFSVHNSKTDKVVVGKDGRPLQNENPTVIGKIFEQAVKSTDPE